MLQTSPLICNRFNDATSFRQLLMTVKSLMYVMINIYSEFTFISQKIGFLSVHN